MILCAGFWHVTHSSVVTFLMYLSLLLLCLGCTRAKTDASTLASLHEQADSEPVLEARQRERRKGRSIALSTIVT